MENKFDGLFIIKDFVLLYNLLVMFWMNKYGFNILLKLFWKFVEENKYDEDL